MMLLKQLLNKQLIIPNKFAILILVLALVGFIDATYLTIKHFEGVIPPCSLVSGCEKVLTSDYSQIFGMPVSLMGAIYYLLVLIGVVAYFENKKTNLFKLALLLTIPGLIFSLWFLYVQAFVLKSYCIYCLGSLGISVILFFLTTFLFIKYQEKNETI